MTAAKALTFNPIGHAAPARTDWLNVFDYGAVGDGSTDDTTAIQAALTAAAPSSTTSATSPANTVYIPPGIYVCGPITIPHRVALRGAGIGTTRLLCKASTANNAIMITNISTATMIAVSDMTLLGNLGNQSNTVHGISFNGSGTGSEYTDMRAQMHNLMVQDFTGDGVTITGRGVCQANAVQAWNNKGAGFSLSIDSEISDCDAGQNGKDGFYITGNTKIANSKAWFSGYWNNGSSTTVQTANVTAGLANGFHFDGSASGCVSTGIYAQDNARAGIYIANSSDRVSIAGWASDSNNNGTGATTYSNVEINNSFDTSLKGGISFDRSANTQHPAKALLIGGGASNCVVEMATQGFSAANKVSISGATYQNIVQVDASGGSYGTAYAATVTPDLSQGSVLAIGALTGNITIAAPVASFNAGMPFTVLFTQDATGGRTVTWNATYQTTFQPNPSPSAVSSITFQWDANDAVWAPVASFGAPITFIGATAATVEESVKVTGDSFMRYTKTSDGAMKWGDGAHATDCTLNRASAGVMALAATLNITGNGSTTGSFSVGTFLQTTNNAQIGLNLLVNGGGSPGTGSGFVSIGDAGVVPTGGVTGGGLLYSKQEIPQWKDSAGNILGMVRTYNADCSARVTVTSAMVETDITGATVSVVVHGSSSTVVIHSQFDFDGSGATIIGRVSWNGVTQTQECDFVGSASTSRACMGRTNTITGVTAGTYTAKLRVASLTSAAGHVNTPHTGLSVMVIEG